MKTNKFIINCAILIVSIISTASCLPDIKTSDEIKNVECSKDFLKENISEFRNYIYGFDSLYKFINKRYCKIDSTTLYDYLLKIYLEYKLGFAYSEKESDQYLDTYSYLVSKKPWNPEVKKIILNEYKFYKEKGTVKFYYKAKMLILCTNEWLTYAMDVYNSIKLDDSKSKNNFDRREIYKSLINKYGNDTNKANLMKLESIIFSILMKDAFAFDVIDRYLVRTNNKYSNSIQRFDRSNKLFELFKNTQNVNKSLYYQYIIEVKNEMSKVTNLTNYEPPFRFE